LTAGKAYRWNVAACNGTGCSSYTTSLYFQTPGVAPATPTSPSPGTTSSPGPTQSSSTVTLSWNASSGATYYEVGVRDIATNTLVVDTTTTSASYTASLTAGKAYRWNVAAGNTAGLSAYTTQLYFQTPATVPNPPVLSSPGTSDSPGPAVANLTPTFSWSASAGATGYGLYIRDLTTDTLIYDNDNVPNSTQLALPAGYLVNGHAYRWNMRAKNASGFGDYTAGYLYFQAPGGGGETDYPGAIWDPAHAYNYTVASRSASNIRWVVIHTTEDAPGSDCSTTRNWFRTSNNPSSTADNHIGVSAHYVICRDGTVYQMVRDHDIAHHAGNYPYNENSIGIEHERHDTSNWTEAQFQASVALVKWLATQYDIQVVFPSGIAPEIPVSGTGIIGHFQVPDPYNPSLGGGINHKTDPESWDWSHYQSLFGATASCTLGSPYFGLTIITHGYDFTQFSGFPSWVTEMADSINCRMGGNVPIRTLRILKSGDTDAVLASTLPSTDEMLLSGSGILVVDWSDADQGFCGSAVPTTKIANCILEFLGQRQELLEMPIHLIGHSRGGSVMSGVAYALGAEGIWVDQITFLDPRPILPGCAIPDFPAKVWNNVLFADNYFQDSLVGGIPVNGTYQLDLSSIVNGDGYNCNYEWYPSLHENGLAHSQIHTYYHGTISIWCATRPVIECADEILIQPRWYESPNPGGWRRETGFYFSRTGGGNRYGAEAIDGLHYRLASSSQNNRQPVDLDGAAWPNATFKPLANYNYPATSPINFTYFYQIQDTDSSMDIVFSLDNDTNPFNDSGNSCYRQIGSRLNNAGSSIISEANTFSWTPTNTDAGTWYVQIKATDKVTGYVRYDYLQKPINITATGQEESDLVIQNLSVTPNTGEPGGTATVAFTIRNAGSGKAFKSSANIRLNSSSTGVTVNDTPLVIDVETPSLVPNETFPISQTVTIPHLAVSGTYYVWVIVDVYNEANQSDMSDASDKAKVAITINVPPPPTAIGNYVQVYSTGTSGLRVRSPNVCDTPLVGANHFDGAQGRVIDGPQPCTISGVPYTLWKIQWSDCVIGWSAQDWLKKIPSATISCGSAPAISTTSPLPAGTTGLAYSQTFQATGGSTPYKWTIVSGSPPSELSLNSSSGVLYGSPMIADVYTFRVRVTGSDDLYSEKDFGLTVNSPVNISITVESSPLGFSFAVDGTTYTTSQSFTWVSGSSHTIATTSPQSGGMGIQYVWSSWSDSGAMSHTVTPTVGTTYTANFEQIGGGDTTAPIISITSPLNNATVTSANLQVIGTASDSGYGNNGVSSVTVNGVSASGGTASGANTANWNATITLNPGANQIMVETKDTLNNSRQQLITVTYNYGGDTVLLQDDFDDNSIDATKWTTSGVQVQETGGIMRVLTDATDNGGMLISKPFTLLSCDVITISRSVYLHHANDYFCGHIAVRFGGLPWVAVYYADHSYTDSNWLQRFGIYLGQNLGDPGDVWHAIAQNSSADITGPYSAVLWDTWFNEKIVYTPVTGIMECYINSQKVGEQFIGIMPTTDLTMQLGFRAWGWGTGHYENIDSISVTTHMPEPVLHSMTVDLNNDGIPNFQDFSVLAKFWGNTSCSTPDWCGGIDFDKSGIVDIQDLQIFAELWLWPVADIDMDGVVNMPDFADFAGKWDAQNCTSPDWCAYCDFNKNGSVDLLDLEILAEYWLWDIRKADSDLNADGKVNMSDFNLFAPEWRQTNCVKPTWCAGADLNKDTQVDILDLAEFAEHWLEGV
jgi:hypothetical protein